VLYSSQPHHTDAREREHKRKEKGRKRKKEGEEGRSE
jgi:hypothetical protein